MKLAILFILQLILNSAIAQSSIEIKKINWKISKSEVSLGRELPRLDIDSLILLKYLASDKAGQLFYFNISSGFEKYKLYCKIYTLNDDSFKICVDKNFNYSFEEEECTSMQKEQILSNNLKIPISFTLDSNNIEFTIGSLIKASFLNFNYLNGSIKSYPLYLASRNKWTSFFEADSVRYVIEIFNIFPSASFTNNFRYKVYQLGLNGSKIDSSRSTDQYDTCRVAEKLFVARYNPANKQIIVLGFKAVDNYGVFENQNVRSISFTNIFSRNCIIPDLNRKYTLLEFWGTWCAPCKIVSETVDSFMKRNDSYFAYIGIPVNDSIKNIMEYASKHKNLQNQIYNSTDNTHLSNAFKIVAYPTFFLIDPYGKIIIRKEGIGNFDLFLNSVKDLK